LWFRLGTWCWQETHRHRYENKASRM